MTLCNGPNGKNMIECKVGNCYNEPKVRLYETTLNIDEKLEHGLNSSYYLR